MHEKNIQIKYQQIYRQIVRKHRLLNLRQIGARTLRFLSITGAAVAAFLLINLLFDVSPVVRLTFAGLLILWSLVYSVMRIFPRVKEIFRPSVEEIFFTAKQLGMTEPSVQDALLNYLQIYQNRSSHTSPMLKNLALEQLYRRFSHFEFSLSLRAATLLRRGRLFLIELLAVLLIYLVFPETVGLALKKIVLPWKNIRTPVPVQIYNHTGNRTVLKNDPLVLAGEYRGEKPKKLFLVLEDTTGRNLFPGANHAEDYPAGTAAGKIRIPPGACADPVSLLFFRGNKSQSVSQPGSTVDGGQSVGHRATGGAESAAQNRASLVHRFAGTASHAQ